MNLAASIEGGLQYLRANQSDSGFWSDWQLPPGESRTWTTAYIGCKLASMPQRYGSSIKDDLIRAQEWLRASEFQNGGWGYAEETGPDADSTSLALLFLHAQGVAVASKDQLRLFQQADGGFSTYTRDTSYGSWTESHPDVTAVALNALWQSSSSDNDRVAAGMRYLRRQQREDGLWDSFWWTSCLYATEAALALLQSTGERADSARFLSSLRKTPTPTVFESALLLLCLIRTGNGRDSLAFELARVLQAEQLPDGSWPSRPILRLTSRHVREPWTAVDDAGPLFGDQRRLFTSATVLAALAIYEDT
jgi:Squalene-hopene cyclase C-terminal domain